MGSSKVLPFPASSAPKMGLSNKNVFRGLKRRFQAEILHPDVRLPLNGPQGAPVQFPIRTGKTRRLEFDLGAGFDGACGFALVLALSQVREPGLGPFGGADLHPRRNPLDRQGRFARQAAA